MQVTESFEEVLTQNSKCMIDKLYEELVQEKENVAKTAKVLVEKMYEEFSQDEEKVSKTTKSLINKMYEEIVREEENIDKTAKTLIEKMYGELVREQENIDKTAKTLIEKMYGELVREQENIDKTAKTLIEKMYGELVREQENIDKTAKSLIDKMYKELVQEEENVDKTAKSLIHKMYKELVQEEENVDKTAKSLFETMYDELVEKMASCNKIGRKQSRNKLDFSKTKSSKNSATLKKKRVGKKVRAALIKQAQIEEISKEVLQFEAIIEIRGSEVIEANCELEELEMEKKALLADEINVQTSLSNAISLVDTLKKRHDHMYTKAEATMSKLKDLRLKTYKFTKWQRFKLLFFRCFGGVEHHYVRDRETKVDEIVNECDAALFATSSNKTILEGC